MYYGNDFYSVLSNMYDDDNFYQPLRRAQVGLNNVNLEPISSDYPDYRSFKEAHDRWLANYSAVLEQIPDDLKEGYDISDSSTFRGRYPVDVRQQQMSASTPPSQQQMIPAGTRQTKTISYKGPSVVDMLASIGEKSDYNTRKQLAKTLGIRNYRGTADQNILMMQLISQNPSILDSTSSQQTTSPTSGVLRAGVLPGASDSTTAKRDSIIPIVKDTLSGLDSSRNKGLDSSKNKGAGLPKPTKSEDEGMSTMEKALIAGASILTAGGLGAAAYKEATDIAKNASALRGKNFETSLKDIHKKTMPGLRRSVKAWENLGPEGQATYNQLQDLYDEGVQQARRYKDLTAEERVMYDLLDEQQKIARATPKQKSMLRLLQKYAPKGTPKLTIPNTPPATQAPTAPTLPKPTSSYQKAMQYLKSSKPFQKTSSFTEELLNSARNLRNSKNFQTASKLLKRLKFEEGGQQEGGDIMSEVFDTISTKLEENKSPNTIAQELITMFGISQKEALDLINQVSMLMVANTGARVNKEQQMMQYGGGSYSGTYDASTGSYFSYGGAFVPTYGEILPEYMYGSDYDYDYMEDGGSLNIGDTLDVTPEEIEYLRQQGYDFDLV